MLRVGSLTALAMIAFAANSVLARLALSVAAPNALAYTGIRLLSGAVVLWVIVALRQPVEGRSRFSGGGWPQAAALFGYALAFSVAYLALGAATGALILFASVQFGMLAWATVKGDRPGSLEWLGLAMALGGLVFLVLPGLSAPDPAGAAMMVAAGLCWAVYSLIGRGSSAPLADTAGNFIRCLPAAIALAAVGLMTARMEPGPAMLAMASGALASGLGYAVWYTALPALSRARAAIVQLTVPVIAAAGGVLFIHEPVTPRLIGASAAIIGGVALAILSAEWRRSRAASQS